MFQHTIFLDRAIRPYHIMEEPGIESTANPIDWIFTSRWTLYFGAYYFFRWYYSIVPKYERTW